MLAVDEILCSSVMNVNGVKCSLSSYLVIEVENNHKLSVVAVGVVPRFSLKRGLLQSFILILLFSVKTWMRFFFFSEFPIPFAFSIFRKYIWQRLSWAFEPTVNGCLHVILKWLCFLEILLFLWLVENTKADFTISSLILHVLIWKFAIHAFEKRHFLVLFSEDWNNEE